MARSASKRPKGPALFINHNGLQRFKQLDAVRQGMIRRFESYASVTVPKVCLPDGVNQNSSSIQHDWTSVGAQLVNHVSNKITMALFQPGLPFFRLDPNKALGDKFKAEGIKDTDVRSALVAGEQRALKIMDQEAIRPKLYEAVRALVVVGNSLLDLSDPKAPRVVGIKHYVVKRSISGDVQEILHRERVLFDELTDDVQAVAPHRNQGEEAYVEYVRWFKRQGKKWVMRISVDGLDLGERFTSTWTLDKFPVYPLVWDLADEHNYGTGLVEDYAGDFGTLSTLSESEIKAAILVSDFRWLANPAGVGDIEEFKRSSTGDVIPGVATDLSLVAHVSTNALQQIGVSAERVISRLGRAFLMGGAVTRDAERVTAEEIRMVAQELETSLGGVYSRLAVDLQLPIARWLLLQIDVDIEGTDLVPSIVTGLAALSRNAEAQQLALFLAALSTIANVGETILPWLKLNAIISTMAAAYGIDPSNYVLTEEEYKAMMAAQQAQQQEAMAQQAATQAGADRLSKEPTQ